MIRSIISGCRKVKSFLEEKLKESEPFSGVVSAVEEGRDDHLLGMRGNNQVTIYKIQGENETYLGALPGWNHPIKATQHISGKMKRLDFDQLGNVYGVLAFKIESRKKKYYREITEYTLS